MRHHLTSIVAIDRNGAIGCKNELPWVIKSDMAFFRKTTMNNVVIMGRKTYQSIGTPLKGRLNLVLSHNSVLFSSTENCHLVTSIDQALAEASAAKSAESFVIGGAATYSEFAGVVDRYLVTFVDHIAPDGDAFLSQEIRDMLPAWEATEIASLPAVPGQDEFAFRIVEFVAPDQEARRRRREEMVEAIRSKRLNAKPQKSNVRSTHAATVQEAFHF